MAKEKPIEERVGVLEEHIQNYEEKTDDKLSSINENLEKIFKKLDNGLVSDVKKCVKHVEDSEKKVENKKDYWRITIRGMTLAGFGAILTIAIAVIKYLWLTPGG